jgi:hypothetical protein
MTILITGGLLGLAVLAILGAVLLGVGEDRAEKAKKELQMQQALQNSVPAALPRQAQSRQVVSQGPAYSSVPATPILPRQTLALPASSAGEATGSLSLASLDGQVSEITSELRALALRAGELEQRLTMLSEVLERHEQSHSEPSHTSAPADIFAADTETQVL